MTGLINSAVELMLVGMGIVYLFLGMLVVAVNLMSTVLRRFFPVAPPAARVRTPGRTAEGEVAAAISAAVHRYRTTQTKI